MQDGQEGAEEVVQEAGGDSAGFDQGQGSGGSKEGAGAERGEAVEAAPGLSHVLMWHPDAGQLLALDKELQQLDAWFHGG